MSIVATLNIAGTVTDADGNSVPFSTTANQSATDVVTIVSATVSPDPAVAGTLRTLTVIAKSSLGEALTATITSPAPAPGSTAPVFTPVPNQPAGQFQWTFTY